MAEDDIIAELFDHSSRNLPSKGARFFRSYILRSNLYQRALCLFADCIETGEWSANYHLTFNFLLQRFHKRNSFSSCLVHLPISDNHAVSLLWLFIYFFIASPINKTTAAQSRVFTAILISISWKNPS